MAQITLTTTINAPIERVFDLARSIDAHMDSTSKTNEIAIDGVTSGLIGMGEEVTWRATHFGLRQRLRVRISAFDRPNHFADEMVFGAFKSTKHTHLFYDEGNEGNQTRMVDELVFRSPMGVLGTIAERVFLTAYMRRFLIRRNEVLKELAESDGWERFIRA